MSCTINLMTERRRKHSHLTDGLQFLGSAYALGASSDQLKRSYEHEITQLVPIARGFIRGDAISKNNWRDFLGQKQYVDQPKASLRQEPRVGWLLTLKLGIPLRIRTFSTRK